jgi:D-alanyl-lipoteichoic acid acyltransferase DltB (MBOAT superfamily)
MLFNSFSFLLFLPTVTLLYFLLPHRFRWMLLLASSCLFYMAFIPVYILVLFVTILIDYFAALRIETTQGRSRKLFLIGSIVATCAVLSLFKYFNFFNENIGYVSRWLGIAYEGIESSLLLPIGLSFHTFQSLSYVIEVYRGRQKAERHFGIYSLYVMFFPQLVAGPIERPQNLLHQFYEKHGFDATRVSDGLRLILWGMFMKVVIADRLAMYVDGVYADVAVSSPLSLLIATYGFAIQIYCDFAGYSNIAIGAALILGFRLMQNFDRPYAAASVSEFWRRWHISLSTWFRDYVYVPLGGNKATSGKRYLNLLWVFLLSGLWHGASWTFVVWGGLHGMFLIVGRMTSGIRNRFVRVIGLTRVPRLHRLLQCLTTFHLVCVGWVYFRAATLSDANLCLTKIAGWLVDRMPVHGIGLSVAQMVYGVAGIVTLCVVEVLQGHRPIGAALRPPWVWQRWGMYASLTIGILLIGVFDGGQFIYFQF